MAKSKIALNLSKRVLQQLFDNSSALDGGKNPLLPEGGDFGIDPEILAEIKEEDINYFLNDTDFMTTLDHYLYRVANDQKVVTVALWKEFERVLEKSLPKQITFRPMTHSEKEAYDGFLAEAITKVFTESKAKNQFTSDLAKYRG